MRLFERYAATRDLGLVHIDDSLRVLHSDGAVSYAESPTALVVGADVREAFPELVGSEETLAELLSGERESWKLQEVSRDGQRWFDLHAMKQSATELVLLVEDSTERSQAVAQLVQVVNERELLLGELALAQAAAEAASRAKTDFVSTIAHELRTPLNSILGFTRVIRERGAIGPEDALFLERVSTNGEQMLRLIADLMDLSQVETGRLTIERQTLDVAGLVREVVEQVEAQVAGRPVALVVETPDERVLLLSDPLRLRQILLNLLGNAIKFTKEGEIRVRLIVDAAGHPLALEVQDSGVGIPPDRLEEIFSPFAQLADQPNPQLGGSGLGLAITRSLVRALGYHIGVESTVGEGSCFRLSFHDPAGVAA